MIKLLSKLRFHRKFLDDYMKVLKRIHRDFKIKDLNRVSYYVCNLLDSIYQEKGFLYLKNILEIIEIILQRNENIVFKEQIHLRFRHTLTAFEDKCAFYSPISKLYDEILNKTKKSELFYKYILIFVVDSKMSLYNLNNPKMFLSIFKSTSNTEKTINEVFKEIYTNIQVLKSFPNVDADKLKKNRSMKSLIYDKREKEHFYSLDNENMALSNSGQYSYISSLGIGSDASKINGDASLNQSIIGNITLNLTSLSLEPLFNEKIDLNKTVIQYPELKEIDDCLTESVDDISFLSEIAFLRSGESQAIRQAIDYLKYKLDAKYNYKYLLSLLKIYNELRIQENDIFCYLKNSFEEGYDFSLNPRIFLDISKLVDGFFKYYFYNLYFIHSQCLRYNLEMMDHKKALNQFFEPKEIIPIQNILRCQAFSNFLRKNNFYSYYDFFFDFSNLNIIDCLTILNTVKSDVHQDACIDRLGTFKNEMSFFIPQLIQLLNIDDIFEDLMAMILRMSAVKKYHLSFIFCLNGSKRESNNMLRNRYQVCIDHIRGSMLLKENQKFEETVGFFNKFIKVASKIKKYSDLSKKKFKRKIRKYLADIIITENVVLPFNQEYKIRGINTSDLKILPSSEKIPLVFNLTLEKNDGSNFSKKVIFKNGDDCRQDIIALQILTMFNRIFKESRLNIELQHYNIVVIDNNNSIIEYIKNSKSRDEIGKRGFQSIKGYFLNKFGDEDSEEYNDAIERFVHSLAGNSLLCYFLNIKDRHNGNILIDDNGRMIHIDFGFMFELSPGNLNIEHPIKITDEIEELLGGRNGRFYKLYVDLMIKGFFSIRRHSKDIVFFVDLSKDAGLPCFTENTTSNLIQRFRFDLDDSEIKDFVISLIECKFKKYRTWIYDKYQKIANNISM